MFSHELWNVEAIKIKLRELELKGFLERTADKNGYGFTDKGIVAATNTYMQPGSHVIEWAAVLCGYGPNSWDVPSGQRRWYPVTGEVHHV